MVSILIDEHMLLRSYQQDDAAALFQAIHASRTHLRPWLGWVDATTKPEHTLNFIQQSLQRLHNQEGLALGIFYKLDIIGGIGMHHWDQVLKKAQIGYWIAKDHEGKGIMSQCAERFVDFLFEKLDLNKVELHYIPSNKRSAAIATRLGARVEGIIRDSFLKNGMFEDMVISGILKKEWMARKLIS